MNLIPRIYSEIFVRHLANDRQMLFVTGPRQVGKSTLCQGLSHKFFNWDNNQTRMLILKGSDYVADMAGLNVLLDQVPVIAFDELHKYGKWKSFLKELFDEYGEKTKIVVTGSSRLDIYKKGGDSLMGRYFLYHVHPFSVAEILRSGFSEDLISRPKEISDENWNALWTHGGFPEPYLKRDITFTRRWQRSRKNQLLKEDVRDITRIQELGQLGVLAEILAERAGEQLVYTSLSKEVRINENTIRAWVASLSSLYYGFTIRPWSNNIKNSLKKEPKWYLRDWSSIKDEGKKAENFVACHLLKAVEGWTDLGMGDFGLFYVRDKQKHEVDFLVTKDNIPWILIEVKLSDIQLSSSLQLMQKQTGAEFAFQVVINLPYHKTDCFSVNTPVVVSARTFLSQLI